jgi:hypothetical protein
MTLRNDECRNQNVETNSNDERSNAAPVLRLDIRHSNFVIVSTVDIWSFVINSSFGFRHSSFFAPAYFARGLRAVKGHSPASGRDGVDLPH